MEKVNVTQQLAWFISKAGQWCANSFWKDNVQTLAANAVGQQWQQCNASLDITPSCGMTIYTEPSSHAMTYCNLISKHSVVVMPESLWHHCTIPNSYQHHLCESATVQVRKLIECTLLLQYWPNSMTNKYKQSWSNTTFQNFLQSQCYFPHWSSNACSPPYYSVPPTLTAWQQLHSNFDKYILVQTCPVSFPPSNPPCNARSGLSCQYHYHKYPYGQSPHDTLPE